MFFVLVISSKKMHGLRVESNLCKLPHIHIDNVAKRNRLDRVGRVVS